MSTSIQVNEASLILPKKPSFVSNQDAVKSERINIQGLNTANVSGQPLVMPIIVNAEGGGSKYPTGQQAMDS